MWWGGVGVVCYIGKTDGRFPPILYIVSWENHFGELRHHCDSYTVMTRPQLGVRDATVTANIPRGY
jgi:hypothetical protein